MKKALKYLQQIKQEGEVLDFEQQYDVHIADAEEACRIAYNEGVEAAYDKLRQANNTAAYTGTDETNVMPILLAIRDLKRLKK